MKNVVRGWTKAKLLSEGRKIVRATASYSAGAVSLVQAKRALLKMGYESYLGMPREGLAGACAYHDLLSMARAYR